MQSRSLRYAALEDPLYGQLATSPVATLRRHAQHHQQRTWKSSMVFLFVQLLLHNNSLVSCPWLSHQP
jgi:hypothetical protein